MKLKDRIDVIVLQAIDHIFEECFDAVGDPEETLGVSEAIFLDMVRDAIIIEAKKE